MRKRLLKERAKAEKAIGKAETEWQQYVDVDQPAYRRWVHAAGGTARTDVEALRGELGQLNYLLSLLDEACRVRDTSPERYLKTFVASVMVGTGHPVATLAQWSPADWLPHLQAFLEKEAERMREEMEQERLATQRDPESDLSDMSDESDRFDDSEDADRREIEDDVDEMFSRLFGDLDDDTSEALRDALGMPPPRKPRVASRSVRDLYRELCRKLHPDAVGEMTPARQQLWTQVQDAYAERDVEALEALLARMELELDPASAAKAAPSRLMALIQHLRNGLRSLQSLIRRGKREPAWGFSRWTEAKQHRVREALLEELAGERHHVRRELEEYRREFKRLIAKALRTARPHPSRTPPPPAEPGQAVFDFF